MNEFIYHELLIPQCYSELIEDILCEIQQNLECLVASYNAVAYLNN